MYHRPPVLLLDEATSALDVETERNVKENLDRLLEGRTAFVVTHRLSTIRDCDVIVVIEDGAIAEHGSHEALMRRDGQYATCTPSRPRSDECAATFAAPRAHAPWSCGSDRTAPVTLGPFADLPDAQHVALLSRAVLRRFLPGSRSSAPATRPTT